MVDLKGAPAVHFNFPLQSPFLQSRGGLVNEYEIRAKQGAALQTPL